MHLTAMASTCNAIGSSLALPQIFTYIHMPIQSTKGKKQAFSLLYRR